MFATPEEAAERAEYIQSLRTGGALGTEYDTVVGTALLHVDGVATLARAAHYKDAFEKAVR